MDLLLIFRKIWRYKLATLPVIALTIVGVTYVVAVKSPVYAASGSYILINPPNPPTPEQIAANPELGRINTSNPYTRFLDPSVIIDVLSRAMATTAAQRELARAGATPGYTVQSAAHFGQSSPIVQVTSKAPTPEAAVHSANIVGSAVVGELARMQRAQRVDPGYWIKALPVDVANTAQLQASGQLRALVGVLAIGAILLFIVVSVVDALAGLRAERRTRRAVPEAMPDDFAPDFWPPANPVPDFDHDGQVVGREEPADDLPGGVGQDLRADFSVATFARGDGATRPTDQQSGTGRWARRSANF